jgi:hypothetical protein
MNVFLEKLKEKGMFLDEKGFYKEDCFQIGGIKTSHQKV